MAKRSSPSSTFTPLSSGINSGGIVDRATGVIILDNDRKIITYYTDIEEAVSEHFKKALPSNEFITKCKTFGPPMKDRSLPDSFWNLPPTSHHMLHPQMGSHELYTSESYLSLPNDWHYPYSRGASMDLTYSNQRFNAQYSHLLLPPSSMRPMSSCSTLDKTQVQDVHWSTSSRYQDFSRHTCDPNYTSAYAAISGFDSTVHEGTPIDHFWF